MKAHAVRLHPPVARSGHAGRTSLFRLFLFAAASHLTACGAGPDAHRFEIITEEGVPTAITRGGPLYQEPLFRLEEVVSVEQDEDIPESLLSAPDTFLPGPGGTLLVADMFEARVVVFDAEGRFVRSIGGKGSGPGQFQLIDEARVEGETLVLLDRQLQRISRMDVHGALLETVSIAQLGIITRLRELPNGRVAVFSGRSEIRDPHFLQGSDLFLLESLGGDTLAVIGTGMVPVSQLIRYSDTGWGASKMPMTGIPSVLCLPGGGFLATDGDVPVIRIYGPDGALSRRIRFDMPERLMTPQLRAAYFESLNAQAAFYGRTRDTSRDRDSLFPEKPGWWSKVRADDAGYLWLCDELSNPAWVRYEPWGHFVIAPDGRWLGTVGLPSRNWTIEGGLLYALPVDAETGMTQPTVYRLVPIPGGFNYP
ncbi:6-bladed beta-propeller [Gemmatimonadota bacterium]